jgi:predicted acyl esterase
MTGGSYIGWSQYAVASMKPKALKAIAPLFAGMEVAWQGGIFSEAFMQMWSALTYALNREAVLRSFPMQPTPPLVDEDGDGELLDEIPLDLNGNGWVDDDHRWPLSRGPAPKYATGRRPVSRSGRRSPSQLRRSGSTGT